MNNRIVAAIRSALLADTTLSTYVSGSPIPVRSLGSPDDTDPVPPYINIGIEAGPEGANHGSLVAEIEVYDNRGPDQRWGIYNRVYLCLHEKRLAKEGTIALRLVQAHVADGILDRFSGNVKLVALFQSPTVLTRRSHGG